MKRKPSNSISSLQIALVIVFIFVHLFTVMKLIQTRHELRIARGEISAVDLRVVEVKSEVVSLDRRLKKHFKHWR